MLTLRLPYFLVRGHESCLNFTINALAKSPAVWQTPRERYQDKWHFYQKFCKHPSHPGKTRRFQNIWECSNNPSQTSWCQRFPAVSLSLFLPSVNWDFSMSSPETNVRAPKTSQTLNWAKIKISIPACDYSPALHFVSLLRCQCVLTGNRIRGTF